MKTFLLIISIALTILGIIVSVLFFQMIGAQYGVSGPGEIKMDVTGQVGDFIGGVIGTIFSLSGFAILLLTLYGQSRTSYVEQFDSKFFELIRIHRNNVDGVYINRQLKIDQKVVSIDYLGRKAFRIIMDDFFSCKNDIKIFFRNSTIDEVYEQVYKKEILESIGVRSKELDLLKHASINFAFCIIFYGVGMDGEQILLNLFKGRYKAAFVKRILLYLKMKPIESDGCWEKWKMLKKVENFNKRLELIEKIAYWRTKSERHQPESIRPFFYKTSYVKYYGGHQHRLSHYFRHLFQSVKFVNSQSKLSFREKYFYVKTLRAQLSVYEQTLLFLNSISILGMPWEFRPTFHQSLLGLINLRRKRNNELITRYNLIKNVPGTHIYGIRYGMYYPDLKFEFLDQQSCHLVANRDDNQNGIEIVINTVKRLIVRFTNRFKSKSDKKKNA